MLSADLAVASVRWLDRDGGQRITHLGEKDTVRFGACSCESCGAVVAVDEVGLLGRIWATRETLWLANLSSHRPFWCWDVDDRSQRIALLPQSPGRPVPFEVGQLTVGSDPNAGFAVVFGPAPRAARRRPRCLRVTDRTAVIDRSTAQFRILELLCESYRQSGGTVVLATSQIVARLELDGRPTSARAVRHHVAELVRKFDVEIDTGRAGSVARHELVIHHALSTGAI